MGTALQNLRSKYPQYDSIPDFELATRIVAKHPQYQNAFADILSKKPENNQAQQETVFVDPVPKGEQGQGGYAQVITMPEQEISATPLPETKESRKVKQQVQTEQYFKSVDPRTSASYESPENKQRRTFLTEFADTRGGNIPFLNPIESIGTLNALTGMGSGLVETGKNILEGKPVDALISGAHTVFSGLMSTPSAIPFNVGIKAVETASPDLAKNAMQPVSYVVDKYIDHYFENKLGRKPSPEEYQQIMKDLEGQPGDILTGKQSKEILDIIGSLVLFHGFNKGVGKAGEIKERIPSKQNETAEYNRLKTEGRTSNIEEGNSIKRIARDADLELKQEQKREYQPTVELTPKGQSEILPSLLVDAQGKPIPIAPVREARAPLRPDEKPNFPYEGRKDVPLDDVPKLEISPEQLAKQTENLPPAEIASAKPVESVPEKPIEPIQENKFDISQLKKTPGFAQDVLDNMEINGVSPYSVADKFFNETFFKLDKDAQEKFKRDYKAETGKELFDTGKDVSQDFLDLGKSPEDIQYLEGTQRGFIALMDEANRRFENVGKIDENKLESRKPDFAKEAEALGAVYQGEQKNRKGEVVFREFRITNPESPAFGANISLKEGENLAERIKAKEAENIQANKQKEPDELKKSIDNLDNKENYTVEDLANDVESNFQDHPKSIELKDALDKFRENQVYDRSVSGRGDMDSARKEFEQAVRNIVGENPIVEVKPESKVFDFSKLNEKELVDKIATSKDNAELNALQKELQSREKPSVIDKQKIAQDIFVINEHLKDNRRFVGRENEIRRRNDLLSRAGLQLKNGKIFDIETGKEIKQEIGKPTDIVEDGIKKEELSQKELDIIENLGEVLDTGNNVAVNRAALKDIKEDNGKELSQRAQDLINTAKQAEKSGMADVNIRNAGIRDAIPVDGALLEKRISEAKSPEELSVIALEVGNARLSPEQKQEKMDLIDAKNNELNNPPPKPPDNGVNGAIFSVGGNIVANQFIQSLPIDDDTKKKLSLAINALTIAGLGLAFGAVIQGDAGKILTDLRGMVAKKALANGWDAERIKAETIKATDDFLKSDEAKSFSPKDIAKIYEANNSPEFKKEASKVASEIKNAEEKEIKQIVDKAKETSVTTGVSLKSILGGGKLSRIERLNIIEKTGQENTNLSDAELIKKAQEYSAKATDGVDKNSPIIQKFFEDGEKYIGSINREKLATTELGDAKLVKAVNTLQKDFEKGRLASKDNPITQAEIEAYAGIVEPMKGEISRSQELKILASLYKLRDTVTKISNNTTEKGLSKEYIEALRGLNSYAHLFGRGLASFKIMAEGKADDFGNLKLNVVNKILAGGTKVEDVLKAAEGVDFNDARQTAEFYRQFVKPTATEILDTYRYINMLSSPSTHIVNTVGNMSMVGGFAPATRLMSGLVDAVATTLTGKERQHYISEAPAYMKGALNSLPEAWSNARDVFNGKMFVLRPDLEYVPTMGAKVEQSLYPKTYKLLNGISKFNEKAGVALRALEASDMFFKKIASSGIRESIAEKYHKMGKDINSPEIQKEMAKDSERKVSEYLLREALDTEGESGQGWVLKNIDKITSGMMQARNLEVGGVHPLGWIVPFIRTPMSLLKRGIEYSPAGIATIAGNKDPIEQYSKSLIGSMVALGALSLTTTHETTWSVPEDPASKKKFYEQGKIPYAIKFGDTWVSYNRLGVAGYPIASVAAIKHAWQEKHSTPKKLSQFKEKDEKSTSDHIGQLVVNMTQYYGDQTFMKAIGDLMDVTKGGNAVESIYKTGGNITQQYIPLQSLVGWTNRFIDPVQRNPKGFEQIYKNTPFASQTIEPFKNKFGAPEKRSDVLINQFSPVTFSKEKSGTLKLFSR